MVVIRADPENVYCIDSTEVTRAQYAAWLATSPSTAQQSAHCSWNTTYVPSSDWPPVDKTNHPVAFVDWCDAFAFCKAAGKRLCGKIGGGAELNVYSSQWYAACSENAKHDYPYGDVFNGQTCNGTEMQIEAALSVGTLAGCQSSSSGYSGVYDLSGNVREWVDRCSGSNGGFDPCDWRGGGYSDAGINVRCISASLLKRLDAYPDLGFRCCSDP
jgi:formylglycine-generating enzyme required for sulfatase activity